MVVEIGLYNNLFRKGHFIPCMNYEVKVMSWLFLRWRTWLFVKEQGLSLFKKRKKVFLMGHLISIVNQTRLLKEYRLLLPFHISFNCWALRACTNFLLTVHERTLNFIVDFVVYADVYFGLIWLYTAATKIIILFMPCLSNLIYCYSKENVLAQ